MRDPRRKLTLALLLATAAFLGCTDGQAPTDPLGDLSIQAAKGGNKPGGEVAGNNLSYPVVWAEGVTKTLPGTPGAPPFLEGEWWYQWGSNGIDPNVTPASCVPDPDAGDGALNPDGLLLCDDGIPLSVDVGLVAGTPPADDPLPLAKAFLQKDPLNLWQAESWPVGVRPGGPVNIDLLDWGDNLESVDWYTKSQVRTEVVLFEDALAGDADGMPWPMTEYEMRHTSGWGIDEVHGMATDLDGVALEGPGTRSTVYSHCARLTIQKLLTERDDAALADLVWVPGEGWTEPEGYEDDLINPHIFNGSVHEGGDGPGYYSAEINVKGRIIYGYTWNVRRLNEGAGDYRLTFSFDEVCGPTTLNTYFVDGITEIIVPVEEEEVVIAAEEGGDTGGGTPVLRTDLNLTYIDIRILERGGGGGGGGGGPR